MRGAAFLTDSVITDPKLGPLAANGDPMKARFPSRRFGEPIEVADLVLFLASPASGFICGQVIQIGGGLSAV